MYGVESCVHPAYQGAGVGGKLMQARFDVAQALNLRGMVAGSAVISYYKVADTVSPQDYLAGVIAGTYWDNNLSKQMRKGFKPLALIPDYLDDPETRGWGVVIVWDNPTFDPTKPIGTAAIPPRRYRLTPHAR
jgi:ribosomal protein S18 acetylase RimI-like enzyme